jgi:hypothetical protein
MSAYVTTALAAYVTLCSVLCHGYHYAGRQRTLQQHGYPTSQFSPNAVPAPPSAFAGDTEDLDYELEPMMRASKASYSAAARKNLLNTLIAALESVEEARDEAAAAAGADEGMEGVFSGSPHKRATFWTPLRGPLPVEASFDQDGGASGGDGLMTRNKAKAMRYGRK